MEKNNINNPSQDIEIDEGEISLMEITFRYLKYWKWFVASVVLALLLGFVYLRYTLPVYNVTSTVLLKHQKDTRGAMTGLGSLDGLEMMGGVSSVVNEIYVIRSISSMRTVIDRLNLHTSYIMEGRLKSVDMYTNSPFIISMEEAGLDSLKEQVQFVAQLNKDNSILVQGNIGGEQYDVLMTNLPGLLNTPAGVISFVLRENVKPYYEPLLITIDRPRSTVNSYSGNLTIDQVDKAASVIKLSLKTSYANKGKDFLNELVNVYNYQTIENKNQEARNTRAFINERLDIIDEELGSAEGAVEQYKREQGMTDLDADMMLTLQQSSRYEQLLLQAETQLNVVRSLSEWVQNPANRDKPVPSNIGVKDPTLAATSNEYNKLLAERERLSNSMEESNPVMLKLNEQIRALRKSIDASIESVIEGLTIERRDIANQMRIYTGKIGDVPRQERQFTEIAREQEIKAALYTLLLQKREENALALAATSNNALVLDEAFRAGIVHPKKPIILLATLLLGLLVPVGVIYLLDILQYKIRTRGDVDRLTKLPVLGEIPSHNGDGDKHVVVSENSSSELDEAFRMIRTRLMMSLDVEDKVVVFTSTIAGEGKSFVAINSAISLALLGKKVLLLGMDMRIPTLHTYMNITNEIGLSTYLSGYEDDISKLIRSTEISEFLSVIPAGPIPPNPAELLSRSRLEDAFEEFRDMFDFIIVDSAPVALVSDTLILNRIADANAYVCRANYSSKSNLKFANDLMQKGDLKNMLLIINDVKDFHHGYGYGYDYGYGRRGKKRTWGRAD